MVCRWGCHHRGGWTAASACGREEDSDSRTHSSHRGRIPSLSPSGRVGAVCSLRPGGSGGDDAEALVHVVEHVASVGSGIGGCSASLHVPFFRASCCGFQLADMAVHAIGLVWPVFLGLP